MSWTKSILLSAIAFWLAGCSQKATSPANERAALPANTRAFPAKGVIKEIQKEQRKVVIQHEAISDYMPAMTMPFATKTADELRGLNIGDAITFRLLVKTNEAWIDRIKKAGTSTPMEAARDEQSQSNAMPEVLKEGDPLPDYRLTNQLGQAVRFGDFRGQALAFTFVFTRCPMPDFCPLMSKRFAEAQSRLSAMTSAPTNWHLLSISFDPKFDTPAILKAYAQRYHYDPGRWSFATGAPRDIETLTDQFTLAVNPQGENLIHKLRTVVVDASGRIQKIFVYNQWTSEELVEEMVKAAKGDVRK